MAAIASAQSSSFHIVLQWNSRHLFHHFISLNSLVNQGEFQDLQAKTGLRDTIQIAPTALLFHTVTKPLVRPYTRPSVSILSSLEPTGSIDSLGPTKWLSPACLQQGEHQRNPGTTESEQMMVVSCLSQLLIIGSCSFAGFRRPQYLISFQMGC